MSLVNLAGAVFLAASGTAAHPAHHRPAAKATTAASSEHNNDAHKAKAPQPETIKIRSDGNTDRPPMSEEEQARLAFEAFLDQVTKDYADLPDEEDRLANQPPRRLDGNKAGEPQS